MFIISRVVFCLIVWSCILFFLSSVGTKAHTLIPITEISEEEKQRLRDSVFMLEIERIVLDETETGNCTGFFVKDKAGQVLFVTAFHCVDGVSSYKLIIGDEEAGVEVVGLDGIHDLALLKLKTEHQIPEQRILSLEERAHSLPPQMLYMPGFPSEEHLSSEPKYHLTQGEFKGTRWGVLYKFATNNSSIGGNSGGPVISSKSQKVIGIVIVADTNLASFIPIDKLKALMEEEDIECPSLEECVEEERKHMKQEASNGNIQAQYMLGVSENPKEAAIWFKRAAEQGYAPAQNELGILYSNKAREFEKYEDITELECEEQECYREAVRWYKKAAEQGYAPAQNKLGEKYLEKAQEFKNYEDVTELECENPLQCYREAVKWYKKAAEQGDTLAQTHLGERYLEKAQEFEEYKDVTELECENPLQCYREAVKWYKKAAEQGDALIQFNLGRLYKDLWKDEALQEVCETKPKCLNEAVKWFKKAAQQGGQRYAKVEALDNLGELYLNKAKARKIEEYKDVTALECENKQECEDKAQGLFSLAAVILSSTAEHIGDEEALKRLYSLVTQGKFTDLYWLKKLPQAQAKFFVAEIYEKGIEAVDKNITEAVKWYKKAAEKKLAAITKNRYKPSLYKRTVTEIEQAANQGNIQAQYDLGMMYECLGESIQAIYWYKKTFNTSTEWCKTNDVQECN